MKTAVIYARVSSREQSEGYSISAQLQLLRDTARKEGIQIVKEFVDIESAGQSGRKQFTEMLKFLKKQPCTLLVEKVDRLYRNFKDAILIEELGVDVKFVKQGLTLRPDSESSDKLLHNINVVLAKNYLDNLSEEVKKGQTQKAALGMYPGGPVLIGYYRKDGEICVDFEIAAKIKRLFELYSSGNYSITDLFQEAKKLNLKHPKSGRFVTRSEIEKILKRQFYCGKFTWGEKVYQGNQPPIVSVELFNKVQEVFKSRNKPPYSKHNFPFIGLIKCGNCKHSVTAEIKKKRYVYYHCTGFDKNCKTEYYRQEVLQNNFYEIIKRITIPQELHDWLKECLESEFKTKKVEMTRQKETLLLQKDKLETRMKKAYLDKLEGKVSNEFFNSVYRDWEAELSGITYQLQNLESMRELNFNWVKEAIELSYLAGELYLNAEPQDKRKLLQSVLSNCELKGGSLYPVYRKPFDILSNGHEPEKWLGDRDSNPD